MPDEMVMTPWLPARGLVMIVGQTGLGKTYFTLGVALAIATGTKLLDWEVPEPRRVLYVDGEMALSDMQLRVRQLVKGNPAWVPGEGMFYLLSHADQERGIPNLMVYPQARRELEELIAERKIKVLILDNLSALCNSAAENDVESWTVMQDWLLKLRRMGISVIFIHHTGKPDKETGVTRQRGTSKREDVLNTHIRLSRDGDNAFEIKYEKHRGFLPTHNQHVRLVFADEACKIERGVKTTRKDASLKANVEACDRQLQ